MAAIIIRETFEPLLWEIGNFITWQSDLPIVSSKDTIIVKNDFSLFLLLKANFQGVHIERSHCKHDDFFKEDYGLCEECIENTLKKKRKWRWIAS